MCLEDRVLVYGDCAINSDPTSAELAQIAIASAQTAQAFGIEPKVALLSYSSGDSGKGEAVEKVKKCRDHKLQVKQQY
jgi:phosphate acetyltransferase